MVFPLTRHRAACWAPRKHATNSATSITEIESTQHLPVLLSGRFPLKFSGMLISVALVVDSLFSILACGITEENVKSESQSTEILYNTIFAQNQK